jgi:hypothetical protein
MSLTAEQIGSFTLIILFMSAGELVAAENSAPLLRLSRRELHNSGFLARQPVVAKQ